MEDIARTRLILLRIGRAAYGIDQKRQAEAERLRRIERRKQRLKAELREVAVAGLRLSK